MDYLIVSAISIGALVVAIMELRLNEIILEEDKRNFLNLASLIILEITLDTISYAIDGKIVDGIYLYKFIKAFELCMVPLIPAMFAMIIAKMRYWKKIRKYFFILTITNGVLQFLTIFIPLMFTIGDNAKYSRTLYTNVYIFILVLTIILVVMAVKHTRIRGTRGITGPFSMMVLLIFSGIVIRMYVAKSNADWLTLTFGFYIFLNYFSNNYLKIDSLSSLLNRRAFDNKMLELDYFSAIIVIDANDFKSINDNFGHLDGDKAISQISKTIYDVYNKVGFCYRIGGDEFVVILRPNVFSDELSKNKEAIIDLLEKLRKCLDEELKHVENDEHNLLQNGVSQGYAIFEDYEVDLEERRARARKVFQQADENMYKDKQKKKNKKR